MKTEEENMEQKICFYEETNFKNTEIGEVPADWEVVKLGDYVQLMRNGLTKEQNTAGVGYPVCRIETISAGVINPNKVRYVSDLTDKEFDQYRVVKDDILFSHINSEPYLGNSAIYKGIPDVLIHGMNLLLIRTQKDKLNPYFLNYLFNYFRQNGVFISIASRAVNQSSINQGKLKNLPIPLLPLEEQKAIAYVLSAVQDAREKTEKVINATKQLKKALMKHLFTYGPVSLEEAERVNLKETEIGPIPEDWEVVKLGEVASVTSGGPAPQGEKYFTGGSFPFVRVQHIDNTNSRIERYDLITEQAVSDYGLRLFPKGTIVLPKSGASVFLEKRAMLPIDSFIVSHLCAINSANNNLSQVYLYYVLQKTRLAANKADNYPTLNLREIRQAVLPLPPLPVQQRIAEILQTVDEKIQAEEKKKQALDNLFNSMLHMLMSGKLRVKFKTAEEEESG